MFIRKIEIRQKYFQDIDSKYKHCVSFLIIIINIIIDVYDACKVDGLIKVKELMPGILDMLNEAKKEYMTLLMM